MSGAVTACHPGAASAVTSITEVYFYACRYLFWTEWGQYPRIERSRLDGSERAVLVNVSISWPNGISIDYEVRQTGLFSHPPPPFQWCRQLDINRFLSVHVQENLLYWCDARTDKIERINLETGEKREVVLASNNMDMFSVSVFESYIYWSDRSDTGFAGGRSCGTASALERISLLLL